MMPQLPLEVVHLIRRKCRSLHCLEELSVRPKKRDRDLSHIPDTLIKPSLFVQRGKQ
jgi:hypothetical protein